MTSGRLNARGVKLRLFSCLVFFSMVMVPAFADKGDTGGRAVNTAAAVRSLERSINLLTAGEWDQARFESELGATYDPTLADFPYIDALCLAAAGAPRADMIEKLESSLAGGRFWRSYDRTVAVLFCARLYAETLRYRDALGLLDSIPDHSSADSDYVRALSLYGLSRDAEARTLLGRCLDRWPFDPRFARLFFREEANRPLTESSRSIAAVILPRLYLWENEDRELLLLAVPFESSRAVRERNIRIYRGMGKSDARPRPEDDVPRSAVLALEYGLLDEGEALDEVFSRADTGIPRGMLLKLSSLLVRDDVRDTAAALLADYAGVITDDANGDGIVDAGVRYRMGRPVFAEFDPDQDGYPDFTVDCQLGKPVDILLERGGTMVTYDTYPAVRSVTDGKREYTLRPRALMWAPVSWVVEDLRLPGEPFYTLRAEKAPQALTERLLTAASAFYAEPSADGARGDVRIVLESGIPVVSESRDNGRMYSRTVYDRGLPSSGSKDEDGDGYFETQYGYGNDGKLSSVMVDRNANRKFEYRESYSTDGSVVKQWDSDEDGSYEIVWTLGPDGTVRTEWIHPVSGRPVVVTVVEGNPRSVRYDGKTIQVIRDPVTDVWWIERIPEGSREIVKTVLDTFNREAQPVVCLSLNVSGRKIFVVRTGGFVFLESMNER